MDLSAREALQKSGEGDLPVQSSSPSKGYLKNCWNWCLCFYYNNIEKPLCISIGLILYYSGLCGDIYALFRLSKGDDQSHAYFYGGIMVFRMLQNFFVIKKKDLGCCYCAGGIFHYARLFLEFKEDKSLKNDVLSEFNKWQYFYHTPFETLVLVHWSFTRYHDIDHPIIWMTFLNSLSSTYFLSIYDAFSIEDLAGVEFSFRLLWELKTLMVEHLLSTSWIWISWSFLLVVASPSHLVFFVFGALFVGSVLLVFLAPELVQNSTQDIVWILLFNTFGVSWVKHKNFILSHRLSLLAGIIFLGWLNRGNVDIKMRESSFYYTFSWMFIFLAGGFFFRRIDFWQSAYSAEYKRIVSFYKNQSSSSDANSSLRQGLLENDYAQLEIPQQQQP